MRVAACAVRKILWLSPNSAALDKGVWPQMSRRPCVGGHKNCEKSIVTPNNQMHA
jgi:hypothetical protein